MKHGKTWQRPPSILDSLFFPFHHVKCGDGNSLGADAKAMEESVSRGKREKAIADRMCVEADGGCNVGLKDGCGRRK